MNKSSELVGISHEESGGEWSFSQRWFGGLAIAGPLIVVLFIAGIIFGLYKLTGGVELSLEEPLVALFILPVVFGVICFNHLIAVCLNKTRILYSPAGVQVKHGPWPSLGYTGLRIDADVIAKFDVKDIGSDTSSSFSIDACDWRGKRYELIRYVEDKHTADLIVSNLTETVDLADKAPMNKKKPGIGTTLGRHAWTSIFFLISIFVIGYAINLINQKTSKINSFTETDGTLVDYKNVSSSDIHSKAKFCPIYEYIDKSGTAHRLSSRVGSSEKDSLGTKIKLRYNPQKPDEAVLPGNFDSHPGPIILIWSWGLLALLQGARLLYVVIRR